LDEFEPSLQAFVHLARDKAVETARASDERWRSGSPLSPIDGMVIGVKDIIETEDMPTAQGAPAWAGFRTGRDSASVQALRAAGAIILGKTTTTEYASTEALAPTRNPHDPERTPGGSSSGSAAAVGAGILPAALGTQVVGSTLRPASFCGCVGFKPSVGALNRSGSYDHLSQSCHAVLAATPGDAWVVASAIAKRVGGDPGYPGLIGPEMPPVARWPKRLAALRLAGWESASAGARAAFEHTLETLRDQGTDVTEAAADPDLAALELALRDAVPLTFQIFEWELLWPLGTYAKGGEGFLSDPMRKRLASAERMSLDDYRVALERRAQVRARYRWACSRYDAVVALAATGAAPKGLSWTGDPVMNVPASLLGVPAISLPVLSDEGLPLGLQVMGQTDGDADLLAVAEALWARLAAQNGERSR
jgi:Asp-tRNA(Asn)/Glu-tRNA(Gln) amidotransferase A subunit family amidase